MGVKSGNCGGNSKTETGKPSCDTGVSSCLLNPAAQRPVQTTGPVSFRSSTHPAPFPYPVEQTRSPDMCDYFRLSHWLSIQNTQNVSNCPDYRTQRVFRQRLKHLNEYPESLRKRRCSLLDFQSLRSITICDFLCSPRTILFVSR